MKNVLSLGNALFIIDSKIITNFLTTLQIHFPLASLPANVPSEPFAEGLLRKRKIDMGLSRKGQMNVFVLLKISDTDALHFLHVNVIYL